MMQNRDYVVVDAYCSQIFRCSLSLYLSKYIYHHINWKFRLNETNWCKVVLLELVSVSLEKFCGNGNFC